MPTTSTGGGTSPAIASGSAISSEHLTSSADGIDVVIVSGEPGVSYGTAQPWLAEGSRAATHWEVSDFDENTGHFEAKLVPDTP
jgi:hypothetical protein